MARVQAQGEEACPCRTQLECPDHYGTRALDVLHYGVLGPCPQFGYFRCCDRVAGPRAQSVVRHQVGGGRGAPRRRRPAEHGSHVRGIQAHSGTAEHGAAAVQQGSFQETGTVAHQGSTIHEGNILPPNVNGFVAPASPIHRGQTVHHGGFR